jgi:hypothetical protein
MSMGLDRPCRNGTCAASRLQLEGWRDRLQAPCQHGHLYRRSFSRLRRPFHARQPGLAQTHPEIVDEGGAMPFMAQWHISCDPLEWNRIGAAATLEILAVFIGGDEATRTRRPCNPHPKWHPVER